MQGTLQGSGSAMKSSSLALKLLQASLIAAPIVLSVAPAQANGTRIVTIHGFTGEFAPANWFGTVNKGSATFIPGSDPSTSLILTKTGSQSGQATRQITISQALIDTYKPQSNSVFSHAQFGFNWAVSGPNSLYSLNMVGPYTPPFNSPVAPNLVKLNGTNASGVGLSPYFLAADIADKTIGFQFIKNPGTGADGSATITDFKTTLSYHVPGPLPILGAGAAFAWSRKLRNRLKMSGSIA